MSALSAVGVPISLLQVVIFLIRATIALLLGACIGAERQWRQRGAGLRTNALVALGACLFELLSVLLQGPTGADSTQIAAYIVSGVGFLGGGVILRQGLSVSGINTAATIWCSAAVGAFTGAGYLLPAAVGATLVLAAHLGLRPIGRRISRLPPADDARTVYRFRAVCRAQDEAHVRALLVQALTRDRFHLLAAHSSDLEAPGGLVAVEAEVGREGRDDVALESAVSRLSLEPGVSSVSWSVARDEDDAVIADDSA